MYLGRGRRQFRDATDVAGVRVPVADEDIKEAIAVEIADRRGRRERGDDLLNASLGIEAKDQDLTAARCVNEQKLVLTVRVQVRGLDVPLLGLDLQLVKIEVLTDALETNRSLAVEIANRVADAVPVGVAEGREVRVGEIAQPESIGVGRRRRSVRGQAKPVEVGELPNCLSSAAFNASS